MFVLIRFMNQRAGKGKAYVPTECEHVANICTHGVCHCMVLAACCTHGVCHCVVLAVLMGMLLHGHCCLHSWKLQYSVLDVFKFSGVTPTIKSVPALKSANVLTVQHFLEARSEDNLDKLILLLVSLTVLFCQRSLRIRLGFPKMSVIMFRN